MRPDKYINPIKSILQNKYGIIPHSIIPMPRGYTNKSFLIDTPKDKYILRVSWKGKELLQIQNEEIMLEHIIRNNSLLPVPILVPDLQGKLHNFINIDSETRWVHIHKYIEGDVLYNWYELADEHQMYEIISQLSNIQKAVCTIAPSYDAPLKFLQDKIAQINIEHPTYKECVLNYILEPEISKYVQCVSKIISDSSDAIENLGTRQWIHKDIQLENILFKDEKITGVLDFDNAVYSIRELDTMFALFNLCRYGKSDEAFEYDRSLFYKTLAFYKSISKDKKSHVLYHEKYHGLWKKLYCLDQSLMHLLAQQKGIWQLEKNIGFLACFSEVIDYV